MTNFTASNGITVFVREGGTVQFQHGSRDESCGILQVFPHSEWWQALREFFQHERDTELGRWRWPENPDYVVYQVTDARSQVRVMHEPTATTCHVNDGQGYLSESLAQYVAAGEAYFAAHPEPKPWFEAQHDEVWMLETPATGERPYQVIRTEEAGFRFFLISDHEGFRPGLFPEEAQITAGRRIWPEATS